MLYAANSGANVPTTKTHSFEVIGPARDGGPATRFIFYVGYDNSRAMARKPAPPPAGPAKRRGRPPKPGGPKPQVNVQRAYRARLKAAGKVVKLVDARFDPAVMSELMIAFRDRLQNTLLKLELREQDVTRLEARNRYLESELVRLEWEATQAVKDRIIARREAAKSAPPPRRRT